MYVTGHLRENSLPKEKKPRVSKRISACGRISCHALEKNVCFFASYFRLPAGVMCLAVTVAQRKETLKVPVCRICRWQNWNII